MTHSLDRLLSEVQPPAPPYDFADRIAERAMTEPQQGGAVPAQPRRDRRGAWMRRPRVLASFIGANLLVASAVAATLAGGVGLPPLREVAVIAPVIEAIAPAPKPKPARPQPRPEAVAAAAPIVAETAPVRPLPPRVERMIARGDVLAERVKAREEAGLPVPPRAKRRAALHGLHKQATEQWTRGEPVSPELKRQIVRERLDLAPPALRERIEQRVEARRAAGLPVAPALDAAVAPATPVVPETAPLAPSTSGSPEVAPDRVQRWRALSPAERQRLIERVRARRAARLGGARQ